MKKSISDFLMDSGMHPAQVNMDECSSALVSEMRAGLAGENSSLMMIPTYFSAEDPIERGGKVIALDAGGTNFRAALVELGESSVSILRSDVFPMPGSRGAITRGEFLDEVCSRIEPLLSEADRIGFCFSFPAEITPERDGRLVGFNKEVVVEDSAGMMVCAEISRRLEQRGAKRPAAFVLLNDTIAAMLGGMVSARAGDTIGFILGTGTNCCYSESGSNIKKLDCPSGSMVINMEAGGFAKLRRGRFDKELDAQTANPGDHIYEKMVSGAYLGKLILLTLQEAARRGLIPAAEELFARNELDLVEVSAFLEKRKGGVAAEAAASICLALIERAAKLSVSVLAGIMRQTGAGKDLPATIAVEGSVFLKAFSFREFFDKYAHEYLTRKLGRSYSVLTLDNMTLAGCAAAASMTAGQ